MCQEVGHTFGLDHQDTSGISLNACMDYYQNTSSSDTKSTTPNPHDYDQLVTIYSHLDSTTTVGVPTKQLPANATADFTNRSEWGIVVRTTATGHEATYVRDLGNGQMLLTFVIWAN